MRTCNICQTPLASYQWDRCEEHNHCDSCQTREGLCHYTEGVFCRPCWEQFVEKLVERFKGDTELTQVPICPHCGWKDYDWWDRRWGADDEIEAECQRCERDFVIEKIESVEFVTRKIE